MAAARWYEALLGRASSSGTAAVGRLGYELVLGAALGSPGGLAGVSINSDLGRALGRRPALSASVPRRSGPEAPEAPGAPALWIHCRPSISSSPEPHAAPAELERVAAVGLPSPLANFRETLFRGRGRTPGFSLEFTLQCTAGEMFWTSTVCTG